MFIATTRVIRPLRWLTFLCASLNLFYLHCAGLELHVSNNGPRILDSSVTFSAEVIGVGLQEWYIFEFEDNVKHFHNEIVRGERKVNVTFPYSSAQEISGIYQMTVKLHRSFIVFHELIATETTDFNLTDYIICNLTLSGGTDIYIPVGKNISVTLNIEDRIGFFDHAQFEYKWIVDRVKYLGFKNVLTYTATKEESVNIFLTLKAILIEGNSDLGQIVKWGFCEIHLESLHYINGNLTMNGGTGIYIPVGKNISVTFNIEDRTGFVIFDHAQMKYVWLVNGVTHLDLKNELTYIATKEGSVNISLELNAVIIEGNSDLEQTVRWGFYELHLEALPGFELHVSNNGPGILDSNITFSAEVTGAGLQESYIFEFEDNVKHFHNEIVKGERKVNVTFPYRSDQEIAGMYRMTVKLYRPTSFIVSNELIATETTDFNLTDYINGNLTVSGGIGIYIPVGKNISVTFNIEDRIGFFDHAQFGYDWRVNDVTHPNLEDRIGFFDDEDRTGFFDDAQFGYDRIVNDVTHPKLKNVFTYIATEEGSVDIHLALSAVFIDGNSDKSGFYDLHLEALNYINGNLTVNGGTSIPIPINLIAVGTNISVTFNIEDKTDFVDDAQMNYDVWLENRVAHMDLKSVLTSIATKEEDVDISLELKAIVLEGNSDLGQTVKRGFYDLHLEALPGLELHVSNNGPGILDSSITFSAEVTGAKLQESYIFEFEDNVRHSHFAIVEGERKVNVTFPYSSAQETAGIYRMTVKLFRSWRLYLIATETTDFNLTDYINGNLTVSGGTGIHIPVGKNISVDFNIEDRTGFFDHAQMNYVWLVNGVTHLNLKNVLAYIATKEESVNISLQLKAVLIEGNSVLNQTMKWGFYDLHLEARKSLVSLKTKYDLPQIFNLLMKL